MEANLGWILTLKKEPDSRLDLSKITPENLYELSDLEISNLSVFDGNSKINFGDFFRVKRLRHEYPVGIPKKIHKNLRGPSLIFEGDLKRVDSIGSQMMQGKIFIESDVGDFLGFSLSGGCIQVQGSTGIHTGCGMSGGVIEVSGDVGDFGASALPGKLQGVTGGTFIINGNVGNNFGNAMRRGLAIILGNAGKYLGSKMVAGTMVIVGKTGEHCGFGMKRGTIIFADHKPHIPSTFVDANYDFNSYWGLISSDLKEYNKSFDEIFKKNFLRVSGDLAFGGKGEWFYLDN